MTSPDDPPSHILVTIEKTDSHLFHDFMSRLVGIRNLARTVIDEAHFALTHDSFRSIMHTLAWLGSINCQIILLSATVGPSLVEALFENFGITQYVVCREKTTRPNISYNVIRSPHPHQTLDVLVCKCLAQPGSDKAIIYCRSREETETTAKRLGLPSCHGSMQSSEINAVLDLLRTGQIRAMVSTTVLGASLDLWDLKWVFHLDYPYDMISYIQESGRVGRNPSMAAFSYVIVAEHSTPRYPTPDRFGGKLVYDWAKDSRLCRRWLMHLFNDGVAEPCSMMDRLSHLCDVCCTMQSIRPDRGIDNTSSADVIRRYNPPTLRTNSLALSLPKYPLVNPPPASSIPIQIASTHSRILYPGPHVTPKPFSSDIRRIRSTLDALAYQCILCWVLRKAAVHTDHLLQHCTRSPNIYTSHHPQWS
ncbi:hypothetical protein PILCRDRAFT_12000 [Piloderma croceum F 1598]|uniref:DNA 3'-5' helicase n=1 Tax=Piloderma croceum (strain F 1598) TaxID=765440 RepID=A0A0C3BJS6_PILCF|nr:hypothetical protein PILCRDRAFT_12000 [Piloderma croceum F 1598]